MSTKSSLVSGPSFHLYEDCFDPAKNVWLELEACEFEATPRGLRIEIPLAVWEVLRQHSPARYNLAALTDAQLQAEAANRVDALLAEYQATLAASPQDPTSPENDGRPRIAAAYFYRHTRLPRDEHITHVLATLRSLRDAQRVLQHQVAELKAARHPATPADSTTQAESTAS